MCNSPLQLFTIILSIVLVHTSCQPFNQRKAVGKWAWEIKAERSFSDQVRTDTVEFTMDGIFNIKSSVDSELPAQVRWSVRDEHLFLETLNQDIGENPDLGPRLDSFRIIPSNRFDRFYIKYEMRFSKIRISGTKIYKNLWGI